jgi:hypothetical protein
MKSGSDRPVIAVPEGATPESSRRRIMLPVSTADPAATATVARLMREIEDEVREQRRLRMLARGGPEEYRDEELFGVVEDVLRRAVQGRNLDALLIPELLDADQDCDLRLPLEFQSHRPVAGPIIVFLKKRFLFPLMHWLYEYSLENFRRQRLTNKLLFASIEELALENAKLRRMLIDPDASSDE